MEQSQNSIIQQLIQQVVVLISGYLMYLFVGMFLSCALNSCSNSKRQASLIISCDFEDESSSVLNFFVRQYRKQQVSLSKNSSVNYDSCRVRIYCFRFARYWDEELSSNILMSNGFKLDSLLQPKYLLHDFKCRNADLIDTLAYDFVEKLNKRYYSWWVNGRDNRYSVLIENELGIDTLVWAIDKKWYLNSRYVLKEKGEFVSNLENLAQRSLLCP